MSETRPGGRRAFLVGLLTGAGVVAAVGHAAQQPRPEREPRRERPVAEPILYRRTEEAERYYRTLYV